MIIVAIATFAFFGSSRVAAQHEEHAGSATAEKLGTVHFDNSCAPAVTADFDRAVALLHSFEFSTAIEGFNRVLAADRTCAIAYWGIALAHWGNPFAGAKSQEALQRGRSAVESGQKVGTPTPRERAYIDAAGALFTATDTCGDRVLAYDRAMDAVARDYPKDIETTIFHALALNQTALPTDKTYAPQLAAAAILEPLFERYPDHPGLPHYIIHAYDHPPLAARALEAARRYAEIAPSAPHALHMPSHTFTRVGAWQESAATNRRSEEVALEQGVITEALHAMDYQTYAFLQMAQDRAARDVLNRLPAVTARFNPASLGGAAPPMAGFFAATAIPARYALERAAWDEAARLEVPTTGTPFTIAIAHFARALGAARSGNPAAAQQDVDRLAALRGQLENVDAYWAEQVDIQRRVAAAWVAFAKGRQNEGIAALRVAADAEDATDKSAVTPGPLAPARELLGEMLLEGGDAPAALAAYEASMAKEPGRFRGAFGAARAAEAAATRRRPATTTVDARDREHRGFLAPRSSAKRI
jgi:hypothetical protein